MNDLIFITAYCETQKQEEVLERCVNSVIKCGYHIALLSHSHISLHIQKKCQYYMYDYNNDISKDYNLFGVYSFYGTIYYEDKNKYKEHFESKSTLCDNTRVNKTEEVTKKLI
jgi:hypothetical protein